MAIVVPLLLSGGTAMVVVLWHSNATQAEQRQEIRAVERTATETKNKVEQFAEKQVEIRIRLGRMEEKIDQLIEFQEKSNDRRDRNRDFRRGSGE